MSEDLDFLQSCDKSRDPSKNKAREEKKFFVYCNMLDELSNIYPKLKHFLGSIKEGFQTSIRTIVANEIKEKGIRESSKILQEREDLTKIKRQFADKQLKLEEKEDIILGKDDIISEVRAENEALQKMLEKHRINGMKLQDENDKLKLEMERIRKMEEDILER